MRAFQTHRQSLLLLGEQAVEAGLIPHSDAVRWLTIEQLRAVDKGSVWSEEAVANRKAELANVADVEVPS